MSARGAIVVVTGPPGAGKSTVAASLVARFDPSALVPGDDFFGYLREGHVDPWLPAAHDQNETVVDAAAAATGRLAAGGITVVYDGVIGPWFADAFLAASGAPSLHYVVLLPDEQLCVERVRTRVGHGFTDLDAARHMYADFAASDLDDRHVVRVAPDDSSTAVTVAVARLVSAGDALVTTG